MALDGFVTHIRKPSDSIAAREVTLHGNEGLAEHPLLMQTFHPISEIEHEHADDAIIEANKAETRGGAASLRIPVACVDGVNTKRPRT